MKIKKYKIAIPKNSCFQEISLPVKAAWKKSIEILQKNNCEIIEVDIPYLEYGLEVYAIITMVEASSNLSRFDGIKFGYREKNVEKLRKFIRINKGQMDLEWR